MAPPCLVLILTTFSHSAVSSFVKQDKSALSINHSIAGQATDKDKIASCFFFFF